MFNKLVFDDVYCGDKNSDKCPFKQSSKTRHDKDISEASREPKNVSKILPERNVYTGDGKETELLIDGVIHTENESNNKTYYKVIFSVQTLQLNRDGKIELPSGCYTKYEWDSIMGKKWDELPEYKKQIVTVDNESIVHF